MMRASDCVPWAGKCARKAFPRKVPKVVPENVPEVVPEKSPLKMIRFNKKLFGHMFEVLMRELPIIVRDVTNNMHKRLG